MGFNQTVVKIFFGYGILIFPLFLLLGPLVSEFFLILLISYAFYFILSEKRTYFFLNKYSLFFLAFYLSILVSTLVNFYNFDYAKSGIFYFRIFLFSIAVWFTLSKYELLNKKMLNFYIIFLSIIIFDSLVQFFTGKNLLGYEIIKSRISSFFGDELILGGFLLRILPIFLVCLIMNNKIGEKKIYILYPILTSLICVNIYLTGERASFFLLILLFSIIFFSNKYLRKFTIFVVIFFVFFSFILPKFQSSENLNPATRMFTKSYEQIIGKGEERYEEYKKKFFNKIYVFSHDHQGHYMLAYRIFIDSPILGTGPKGFRYLCRNKIYILKNNDGCSTHPHNTFVQILTSNGVIGFTLLIISFLYILIEIFKSRKKIDHQNKFDKFLISENIILCGIFINLWPLIPSGNFFNNWLSMMYFYPVGFYLYFKFRNEKKIS
jgi:hypothetical protein